MKTLIVRSLGLLVLLLCPQFTRAAAPVNDLFAKATVIPGRGFTLRNQNASAATAEAYDPYILGTKVTKSVWYAFNGLFFTGTNNGHLSISHTASVRFAVFYQRSGVNTQGGLALLAGTEKANPAAGTDAVSFQIGGLGRYYICVEAPAGTFGLSLKQGGAFNDNFEDAAELSGDTGTVEANNANASNDGDTPLCTLPLSLANGIWYKWTAPYTGSAMVDTNFSEIDPTRRVNTCLYVFTGSTLANLQVVAFDQNTGLEGNSRISFGAQAGTVYYFWAGTTSATGAGPITLSWYRASNPGVFVLHPTQGNITHNQQITDVGIRRYYAGSGTPSVTVATGNGTAVAGTDFSAINTTLNFLSSGSGDNNAFEKVISVTLIPDSNVSHAYFYLNLTNPTSGATIPPTPPTAKDVTPSVQFTFASPAEFVEAPGFTSNILTVSESAGHLRLPLHRRSTTGISTVYFSVLNYGVSVQPAYEGQDFYRSQFSVTFQEGQADGYAGIDIISNQRADGTRTFELLAEPADAGQTTLEFRSVTVNITDDEVPHVTAAHFTAILDAGYVTAAISATGAVTGKVCNEFAPVAFTGKLNAQGTLVVHPNAVSTLTLQLLNSVTNLYQVSLHSERYYDSTNTAYAMPYTSVLPCPAAGLYTIATTSTDVVPEAFVGSLTVTALGAMTLTGKLFDGTAVTAAGYLSLDNEIVLAATPYANVGRFLMSGAPALAANVNGELTFYLFRPGKANQTVELPQIDNGYDAVINAYTPPAPGLHLLPTWDPAGAATGTLDGGGYGAGVSQSLVVSASKAPVSTLTGTQNIPTLKLSFTPATGLFTGTVKTPGATTASPVCGVVLQQGSNSYGAGFFLNPSQLADPGRIVLQ